MSPKVDFLKGNVKMSFILTFPFHAELRHHCNRHL